MFILIAVSLLEQKQSLLIIYVLTGVSNQFESCIALSRLLLQLFVTNATGTLRLPSASFSLSKARTAGSNGVAPLANTPSTSNRIPKSGYNKKNHIQYVYMFDVERSYRCKQA